MSKLILGFQKNPKLVYLNFKHVQLGADQTNVKKTHLIVILIRIPDILG